jgi:Zn-dependent protease
MDISPLEIRRIVASMIVLILSITVHEFGHALAADKLGDDTPRRQGRLTLNPVSHADPIGTLLLPLVGSIYAATTGFPGGFGWGKPVQFRSERLTRKISMATGQMIVALAGPTMNIVLGVVITAIHCVILMAKPSLMLNNEVNLILGYAVMLNFTLFFFNLVPAPPLDGGWILQRFVPHRHRDKFDQYAVYGPFVIMALVMISPLKIIFTWPAGLVLTLVYSLFGAITGVSHYTNHLAAAFWS